MRHALHRSDRAAIGALAIVPVVMFVVPALAGYPVMPGDDHTQNFPLRVLVGWQLRHGHLPLLDPYIWSGAPLLAGWNAGAAYPLTLLFAVLPGVAAWTLNLCVTWWAAGLGAFAFLRASRLGPAASLVGALSFAFAGAMTAQVPHFGLVAGMSWTPVALLACLRLSQVGGPPRRLAWVAALAGAAAMIILAGEPRAIDDAVIVLGGYVAWRAWRLQRGRRMAYLGLVAAGVAIGVAVGAAQWAPGIAAVATSQRAAPSMGVFDSGSLPRAWLLLLLAPDLLGGSGSLGQPAFFAPYNLTEVTGYVGLMPLAGACALLGRARLGRRGPEWAVWHLVALAGVVLALGGNTPLGPVLHRLPFFGAQRLQSRNIMIADFALAVLLAYWADEWLSRPRQQRTPVTVRRVLGAVPGAAAAGVVAVALAGGAGFLRWLGVSPATASEAGPLRPWLIPFMALGCLAAALVWWGPRLGAGRRKRLLVWFVSVDITVFTLLTVVAVPMPGHAAAAPAAAAEGRARAPVAPAGDLARGGRFAVYDPGLLHAGQLTALGAPDSNVMAAAPSIQGYSSTVNGAYAAATGTHQSTGHGQDTLSPRAIRAGVLDQLDTTVLLTLPAYLIAPAGRAPAGAPAADRLAGGHASRARSTPGFRRLASRGSTTWYFASVLPVTSVAVPAGPGDGGAGVRVGLVRPSGATSWLSVARGSGRLDASLARPRGAVGIRVVAGPGGAALGPPVAVTSGGARYRADGRLQNALVPPRWRFGGFDGAFAVFSDSMATPPLTLRALPRRSAAGAAVRATAGPAFAPSSARVSSARGVTVIRAVADIPGWRATWRPEGPHPAEALPVRRAGLVQAVTVPPGRGTLTWRYTPPGERLGLALSLLGLAALAGMGVAAVSSWRRGLRSGAGRDELSEPLPEPGASLRG